MYVILCIITAVHANTNMPADIGHLKWVVNCISSLFSLGHKWITNLTIFNCITGVNYCIKGGQWQDLIPNTPCNCLLGVCALFSAQLPLYSVWIESGYMHIYAGSGQSVCVYKYTESPAYYAWSLLCSCVCVQCNCMVSFCVCKPCRVLPG